MKKVSLGLDFGTLSGRALIVDVSTGEELASATYAYPHAVMEESLPSGKKLLPDFALQHPQDYLDVLSHAVPEVIQKVGVSAEDIVGVGVDFTGCTLIPVLKDGTPLCFLEKYKDSEHAYVKLWKHHAAQSYANRLNDIAAKRNEPFLARYGGKISSEWAIPKIWQILEEAPEIYDEADCFIEAADWLVWQLCGVKTRNACCAGYKAMWHKQDGYPSGDFFAALDKRLENVVAEKLGGEVYPLGSKAGEITKAASELTGLAQGTAVAVGILDAHAFVPALKIDAPGKMCAIIGTSSCHMLLGEKEQMVPGICGYVEDGILPGFYGYEAGQSCVGDHFAWFVEACVPQSYHQEAGKLGKNIHQYLTEKAEKLAVGESGLLALDWWNGNRSVLVDVDLTGMILGMTLTTKPEEIYRTLIESTAFGTRKIVETFRGNGVEVTEFYAAGGISGKNPMMMQIYADVINMPVYIAGSDQGGALGSAVFGSVAASSEKGGHDDLFKAARIMGKLKDVVYYPNPENAKRYTQLYKEYELLHDYFGKGANDVMKRLKSIKKEVAEEKYV